MIWLRVRRLFCDEPACKKRTFAEQVPGLTVRYARKTALLTEVLRNIAVALAGRAGCRLARALQAMASRSTLLRLVMAIPDPPASTPRGMSASLRRTPIGPSSSSGPDCAVRSANRQ